MQDDKDLECLAHRLSECHHRKVYGYVRVSSAKQEAGVSMDAQEKLIREYAEQKGLGEPFIVRETSSAGKRMFKLPAVNNAPIKSDEETEVRKRLLLLLGHTTTVKNSHLIVWKLDRLARIGDERELIYQLMQRHEVELHSTDPGEQSWLKHGSSDDPMTSLVRQVFGAFSQYERAMIEMRMNAGLRFKAARGGYVGGRPSFGYYVKDHELHIDNEQAKMVRYVFMLNKKYSMSMRQISRVIEAAGKRFPHSRVHRIIRDEAFYRGVYRDRFGQHHERPDLKILDDGDEHNYDEEFQP